MKTTLTKSLMATAVLGACACVHAEDSYLEVYGILDAGVASVAHSLPASSTFPSSINPLQTSGMDSHYANRQTAMVNGGMQFSRWGIKGAEDMGQGRKAFFVLESAINLPTGTLSNASTSIANNSSAGGNTYSESYGNSSLNGQLFARQAYVGVSEPDWGTIMFGRNYTQIYDVMSGYDPVFKSDIMSPIGLSGTLGGGGGVSESTRVDSSVKYKNQFGPVNVGVFYRIASNDGTEAGSGYGVNLGYESGAFGVQGVYQAFKNAGALGVSSASATPTVKLYDTEAWLLAGKYKIGAGTVKMGVERYTLKAPTATGATFNYFGDTSYTVAAGTDVNQNVNVYFAGGDYNFSPAFNVAVGAYDIHYYSYAGASAKDPGDIRWYSLIGDYRFSKRTDLYSGLVYIDYSGDKYASAAYKANSLGMVGIRHKF